MRLHALGVIAAGVVLGCGGATGGANSVTDAGPSNTGAPDAAAPTYAIPPELEGRLWAMVHLDGGDCGLLALYVGEGPGSTGHTPNRTNDYVPARLWSYGQKQDITLIPTNPGRWLVDGFLGRQLCVGRDDVLSNLVLVSDGSSAQLQVDRVGQTHISIATFARSRAAVIVPSEQMAEAAEVSADQRFLSYRKEQHPWLWDSQKKTTIDLAPTRGQGDYSMAPYPVRVLTFFQPGGSHVLAGECSKRMASLIDTDLATGSFKSLPTQMACAANDRVQFSADGRRAAYLAVAPGDQVRILVWDLATQSEMPVYTATVSPLKFWLGSGGRHVLYFAPTTDVTDQSAFEPLRSLDLDTMTDSAVVSARFVAPSQDRRFVAFQRADARLVVWDGESGQTQDAGAALPDQESPYAVDAIVAPDVLTTPDGQHVVYWDAEGSVRVLVFGATTSHIIGASVACGGPGTRAVYAGPIFFSHDGRSIATITPAPDRCTGGLSSLHVYDVAAQIDHHLDGVDPLGSLAVGSQGAVGYLMSADMNNVSFHVWSPDHGPLTVATVNSMFVNPDDHAFQFSADGNRLMYRTVSDGAPTVFVWDRTNGVTKVGVNDDNKALPRLDATSGIALVQPGYPRAVVFDRPGSPIEELAVPDSDTSAVFSPTMRTAAMTGTQSGRSGVYALDFSTGKAQFVEGGRLVAASDHAVYFTAADGLCAAPLP
jgi:hypothetical protein